MLSRNHASSFKAAVWARPILSSAALAAIAFAGGCTVHVHDREDRVVYRDREPVAPPPPVVVEEPPAPAPEPVTEVVYEPAPVEVVTEYEPTLSPYGHWVVIERYGRCWVYNNRPGGWRPYTRGHWVASSEGWLWVAEGDEASWGQTCYHYGRWYEDDREGWVWVPGRVWAPSWCAWREGGGYSAWAPLPPECGDGHLISTQVVEERVHSDRFVCVPTRNITNIHIDKTVIVNNVTIINKTTNITNITYVNNRAVNRGVPVKHVEAVVGHPIKVNQTVEVKDVTEARRLQQTGKQVIYTPPAVKTFAEAHPVMAARQQAEKDRVKEEANKIQQNNQERITHDQDVTNRKIENQQTRDKAADDKAAAERAAQLHNAQEKAAMEKANLEHNVDVKAAAEKAALDRQEKEKAALEQTRADHQRQLQEKAAAERAAQDQKAAEKAAAEKAVAEKAAQEKAALAEERANQQRMLQEKAAAEKAAIERKNEEKAAAEKAAQDKAAEVRAAREKAAEDKAAAEKAARDAKNNPDPNNPNKKKPNNAQDPNAK